MAGAVSEGLTPIEYMLAILRDDHADEKQRAWAAEKAAPFVHPRPAPAARPVEIDLPDTGTMAGILDAYAIITNAIATGEIAPSEGQSLSAVLEAQRKAIETGDLLVRVEHLEAQTTKRG